MLNRLGNKKKLIPELLKLFPQDIQTFVDMFMGTGNVSFAMVDRVKYIIANDIDADVFNLFQVLREHKDELYKAVQVMPIHAELFNFWKTYDEDEPLWQAVRFLMLSNFSLLGGGIAMRVDSSCNTKSLLLRNIQDAFSKMQNIQFTSLDFRALLDGIHWIGKKTFKKAFIYADPPYLGTGNNYSQGFTESDTDDLFRVLVNSNMRFGLSEFENPYVLNLAEEYDLFVHAIGERRTLKNHQTEIYISNYDTNLGQMQLFA
jgi:site-specific DNA-adenine methylase